MDEQNDRVFAQLRKLGLRPTSARICVLEVLHAHAREALAVDQIFLALNAMGISISLGTIYRVLSELEQRKLVQREWDAKDLAAKSRYILAPDGQAPQAYELVCPNCGHRHSVTDKLFVEAMQRQARAGGFEQGLATVLIQVRCNQCAPAGLADALAEAGAADQNQHHVSH